ncbi:MAG: C4-dicarboxylate ABC transporter permease, partial [Halomonas sp.]|nr:C4-dicarboxylate ABC transporter permease [Halomonas sp.]
CVVGTYSLNSNMTEVYWMLGFGILGYWLKVFGFQMGPVILGVILGPLLDESYRQAMSSVGDQAGDFFLGLVTNPLSLVLTSVIVLVLLGNTPFKPWLTSKLKRGH